LDEQLEQLLALQRMDKEIERIRREQVVIPEEMTAIEERLRESELVYAQEKERLTALNKRRISLENDLVLLNERLKKYQLQLMSAKTNQEYQAFLREIDATKAGISRNEEDILGLMDDGEQMTEDLSARETRLAEEKTESAQQIDNLKDRLDVLAKEYAARTEERKELVAQMGDRLVLKYERIKNGRGGDAVVLIGREVCSGCHTTLPPQFAAEIKKGDQILTCESCGRILIWESKV
jgi:predicted  nucleic acid-binding Zn-ribbon protein